MPRRISFAILLAIQLLPATAAWGQQHMLEYVLPRGGTRGTTEQVAIHGQYLNDPREVLFYGQGIQAAAFKPGAKPAEDFKVSFRIAPDCPLGEHVLRVRTATGLSDAMTFWVTPFPQVMEAEKKIGENDSIDKAQRILMNSTVEGQIQPGDRADRDYYLVTVKKGERISVELESVRLGTLHSSNGENALAIRILDAEGMELGHADGSALYVQDPILSLLAPATGYYFIEVTQKLYQRADQIWYRAHIGNFMRPTGVYPAGGRVGEKLSVRILGDPAGERTETVALPDKPGDFNYFAGAAGEKPPSPNVLRVSTFPNVFQAEGQDPTPVPSLPAALNGIFTDKERPGTFQFKAKKNDAWRVSVYARTVGSPMDPRIWIRAANSQKNILDAEDSKLADLGYVSNRNSWFIKDQLDPVVIFKVPADGDYVLGIADTRGLAGPDYIYRVEIEPVRDTVYTHITGQDGHQIPRQVGLIVPQGNRWTVNVQLAQGLGNNYKGEIELEAAGLPPGVKMITPHVSKGVNKIPVQFIAGLDTPPQSALIELLARPVEKVALDTESRQAFALFNRPGEYPWHLVFLDKYALAVTDPAPFHLEMEQPSVALSQSGEMLLKVKLNRHGDFKGPVEIQADWLPPNVSGSPTATIPPEKTEGEFKIQANNKAAAGTYQIAMTASTTGGDGASGIGRIRVSSPFVNLEVAEPYVTIDLKRSSIEQGRRGSITAILKQNRPFDGSAKVVLTHLPKGVTMIEPAPQITAADTQVTFNVEASAEALLGLYKEVSCEVTLVEKGQTVKQQTGSGILRIDPSRASTVSSQ
jgi:hypothetical protein